MIGSCSPVNKAKSKNSKARGKKKMKNKKEAI